MTHHPTAPADTWKVLGRHHDWVVGATITESYRPDEDLRRLKRMQRHRSVEELFAWAAALAPIPRIQPQFFKDEHQSILTLPGDPTYPTIDGWEIPEDTRFVLHDGRWRPVQR